MPEPAVSPTGMYSARVQATPWGILKLTKALLMFPGCISRNLPSAPSSAGQTHTQAHARKHTDSPPPPPGAPTSGALKLQAPSARTPPGHSMPCLVGTACSALWAQHALPCGHSMFCLVGTACSALWAQHVLLRGHSMPCLVGTACPALHTSTYVLASARSPSNLSATSFSAHRCVSISARSPSILSTTSCSAHRRASTSAQSLSVLSTIRMSQRRPVPRKPPALRAPSTACRCMPPATGGCRVPHHLSPPWPCKNMPPDGEPRWCCCWCGEPNSCIWCGEP